MNELSHYLPAVYQGEFQESSALSAILSVTGEEFTAINHLLDGLENYFDPFHAPIEANQDYLKWLSSWVSFVYDEEWNEQKKRYSIANAANFYNLRGTKRGLKIMLEHFFDASVEIREWRNPTMVIGHFSTIGKENSIIQSASSEDYFFHVTVTFAGVDDRDREVLMRKVRHIIELEKPAHTIYALAFKEKKTIDGR